MLNDNIINFEGTTEVDCEALVTLFSNTFHAVVKKNLENNTDIQDSVECIIDYIKTFKVAKVAMNKVVIETSKKLSSSKRAQASQAVDDIIRDKVAIATKLCLVRSRFDSRFMSVLLTAKSSSPHDNDEQDKKYCTRRFLTDNKLIDTSVYTVNLNPDHIDTTGIEYDQIMKNIIVEGRLNLSKIFNELGLSASEEISECVLYNIRRYEIFEAFERAAVLGEIGVSDEIAKAEEKLYLQKNALFFNKLSACHTVA